MGLSQADIQGRQAVAQEVQTLLRPHLPGTVYFKSINLKTAYGTCGLHQAHVFFNIFTISDQSELAMMKPLD
jgi:hypothetical protein